MKINVLKKGDRVLNVTSELIAVERKNGEVELIPLKAGTNGVRIDYENIVTVGYGNNVVELETEDGITITNF